ncbi:conserved hypothetical protein [Leishmania major strain Friedlin]|uniref:Uncharacterized protein n=1 Tax=Leishmania major TaxID=5664 RepID=Q4Q8M2_LEIMA|nr:conserved hypothetical protein [Leishmania major strain Friedlin]CAG9577112.1 hypothetical_protein_-_conserved [Leishmania major strain Friedlin]CAJ04990.1 conserved hypothetical protein [Leishmania major strain Friedlin]|eukprot:XP_001684326.1 conserved hypothetical protein [Leishmania major strain Friedlin]
MRQGIASSAPPSPQVMPCFKPQIIYSNETSERVGRATNATMDALNAVLHNASSQLAAATATLAPNTSAQPLPIAGRSGRHCVMEDNFTTARTTTNAVLNDSLSRTTGPISRHVPHLSLVHVLAWFLLFATITVTTVTFLNYCLRSKHGSAYSAETGYGDEEMCGKTAVPFSVSSQSVQTEGLSGTPSSSSRLLASRGNLARQQFLESRKSGSNPKCYGATTSTSPAN